MKLASLRDGTRDGRLAVVAADLSVCVDAADIAPTLQAALDDWEASVPRLRERSESLAGDAAQPRAFDPANALAPLPRAYQWADGSAYVNHVALVRRARGAEMPESFWTDPLIYQGGADGFLAPREPIRLADEAWGIDFEGEVAVITGDVPMGATRDEAAAAIRLVMIANDVSLRALVPGELAKGFGFYQSKPASAFAPCAVTPDALGAAWDGGRLHRPLEIDHNGEPFGRAQAGEDMTFDFPDLIVHAARTRTLCAGTIIGSGTVSNLEDGEPARPIAQGGPGYSCIAELRMIETLEHGAPRTEFMRFGDTVRIEMMDAAGDSIFGAIEQTLEKYERG